VQLLSDATFTLYDWLCLNSDRRTDRIRNEVAKPAVAFGVEVLWVYPGLAELCQRGAYRTEDR